MRGSNGRNIVCHVFRQNVGLTLGLLLLTGLATAGRVLPFAFSPVVSVPGNLTTRQPSAEFWFGTDTFAFDIFSRVFRGVANDIPIAIAGVLLALAIGVPLGLFASIKGRAGEVVVRSMDAFQSFPLLVLAIAAVVLLGNKSTNVIVAIAIINVPRLIRIIRSEALAIRESRFIEAAFAIGASTPRMLFRHLLPNVMGVVLVQASLSASAALVIVATLSFLGVGVSPPEPTLGFMIQEGSKVIAQGHWWVVAFPSLMVFLAVAAFNMVADGLQSAISRKEREG